MFLVEPSVSSFISTSVSMNVGDWVRRILS